MSEEWRSKAGNVISRASRLIRVIGARAKRHQRDVEVGEINICAGIVFFLWKIRLLFPNLISSVIIRVAFRNWITCIRCCCLFHSHLQSKVFPSLSPHSITRLSDAHFSVCSISLLPFSSEWFILSGQIKTDGDGARYGKSFCSKARSSETTSSIL